jgi:CheY-like chemotaxis protein
VLERAAEVGDVVVDTGFSLEHDAEFGRPLSRNQLTLDAVATADVVVVVGSAEPTGLARLARTPEQLIDHVTMSLHAPLDRLSTPAKAMIAHSRHADAVLTGLTAVVIDDDIRNIFSLASALEEYGIELRYAESGREGLELLDSLPEVDMVLVDIMMPDMDGYETMREIRARPRFSDLPVIAVTAKAMKGDRQKCIEAGAWDYISKPVDPRHLMSVLRGWLCH